MNRSVLHRTPKPAKRAISKGSVRLGKASEYIPAVRNTRVASSSKRGHRPRAIHFDDCRRADTDRFRYPHGDAELNKLMDSWCILVARVKHVEHTCFMDTRSDIRGWRVTISTTGHEVRMILAINNASAVPSRTFCSPDKNQD